MCFVCIFIIYINKIVDDSTHKFRIFRFGTVEYIFGCNHLNLLDFKFNISVWCKKNETSRKFIRVRTIYTRLEYSIRVMTIYTRLEQSIRVITAYTRLQNITIS